MPRHSRIEQVTQTFAVQISAPILVRFLEEFGDVSTGSEIKVRTGSSLGSYTNSSLSLSTSSHQALLVAVTQVWNQIRTIKKN